MGRWHLNRLLNTTLEDLDVFEYSPTADPMKDVYGSLSLSRYDLNPERHDSGALCFREP